jgi:hypothetical protein
MKENMFKKIILTSVLLFAMSAGVVFGTDRLYEDGINSLAPLLEDRLSINNLTDANVDEVFEVIELLVLSYSSDADQDG